MSIPIYVIDPTKSYMCPPRGKYDRGLEAFLHQTSYGTEVQWSDRVADRYIGATSLMEAVQKPLRATRRRGGVTLVSDVSAVRENRIQRMIDKPLSPRKPVLLPCQRSGVIERDKQRLERVVRQRHRGGQGPIVPVKDNAQVVRPMTIGACAGMGTANRPKTRTFYWGA